MRNILGWLLLLEMYFDFGNLPHEFHDNHYSSNMCFIIQSQSYFTMCPIRESKSINNEISTSMTMQIVTRSKCFGMIWYGGSKYEWNHRQKCLGRCNHVYMHETQNQNKKIKTKQMSTFGRPYLQTLGLLVTVVSLRIDVTKRYCLQFVCSSVVSNVSICYDFAMDNRTA